MEKWSMEDTDAMSDQFGIENFFKPKSIAVIGASANLGKLGGRPIAA